jgi:hypothetical protein
MEKKSRSRTGLAGVQRAKGCGLGAGQHPHAVAGHGQKRVAVIESSPALAGQLRLQ